MKTKTGRFRIGLRQGNSKWERDLTGLCKWAQEGGFELIDLTKTSIADIKTVKNTGMDVVSADLLNPPAMLSADAGKRKDILAQNAAFMKEGADLGIRVFMSLVTPEKPDQDPKKNFELAVESFGQLAQQAAERGTMIVLEGYPGGRPHYANLCCNPESYRAILKEVPKGLGINFDPSHLIRQGIDHARFVAEFAPHIGHVHGKDTEILTDRVYELGYYQSSILQKKHGFGEYVWRYTIPGRGITRWSYIFQTLLDADYTGAVSVELEDENYNGSEETEKKGILASLAYLQTV